ncbi:uncharacterized protein [Aegilops tauschii subsp. strangulata]|uniref:uncharacterized protein isoform X2 n=1 Tax=Aegilops tauschii subsp. strangulata TaxID=200361 RepID=UPI001ABC90A8|nr:uncharacterized protein LOC109785321 isoform X3 [Aegilops tauschii subsp. strangulata]
MNFSEDWRSGGQIIGNGTLYALFILMNFSEEAAPQLIDKEIMNFGGEAAPQLIGKGRYAPFYLDELQRRLEKRRVNHLQRNTIQALFILQD